MLAYEKALSWSLCLPGGSPRPPLLKAALWDANGDDDRPLASAEIRLPSDERAVVKKTLAGRLGFGHDVKLSFEMEISEDQGGGEAPEEGLDA